MNPLTQFKNTTILPVLIALTLVCFALSPMARAVDPPPDGGYPNFNTAEGDDALFSLTTGGGNTAIGFNALFSNTTGFSNTATGNDALGSNTTGIVNTATGYRALESNTSGSSNTATGFGALESNTTGYWNTSTGVQALFHNTIGFGNTATGFEALYNNMTGLSNTANGEFALITNTTGSYNTAVGNAALRTNRQGIHNTAVGSSALQHSKAGKGNIALGYSAGIDLAAGNDNIYIGNLGKQSESANIRIGTTGTQTATFIAGIRDVTTGNGDAIPVVIDSAGQLGTLSSSQRFKNDIKPMNQSSEAILGLKPVTFHYKSDAQSTPQFGLIAEDVAKVNPHLVARDAKGEIYTVRYEAVNAMLLNEFLKEHRKVEEQGAIIAKQQKQIEALTAGLQKVSAQVEMIRPAPQTVVYNH